MIKKMKMQTGVSYKVIFFLLYVNIEHHLMNSNLSPTALPLLQNPMMSAGTLHSAIKALLPLRMLVIQS